MTTATRALAASPTTSVSKPKLAATVTNAAPAAPGAAEILAELESVGSAQTAKTYRRHGVTGPVWGVSYAELGKLTKRLKTNHALAEVLWASGIHDARVLATMIADPAHATEALLEGWLSDMEGHVLVGAVSNVAARHPDARAHAERWIEADLAHVACLGWQVLAMLAMEDTSLPDSYFADLLPRIETAIAGAQNRVRYDMNNAVIAIGGRSPALREAATATARRIGPVKVDHGDTACKTPDAVPYIDKMWARRKGK